MGNEELIDKIRSNDCNIFDCTNGANEVRKKIYENDKCTDDCSTTEYNYEYKFKCYDDCPPNSMKREKDEDLSYLNLNKNFFCKPICNEDNPFEIIIKQECVEKCEYKEIKNKSCILNYKNYITKNNKTENIYNNLLKNAEDEFTLNNYNTTNLENGNDDIP